MHEYTGHPIVDSSLELIAHLSNKDDGRYVENDDIEKQIRTLNLGAYNNRLRSYTMIFGTNGPLMQASYKKVNREQLYNEILINMLRKKKIGHCDICGESEAIDLISAFSEILKKYNLKPPEEKVIGRDMFPMLGSLGNDAQALPCSSRAFNLCPRCAVSVHFIPLISRLIDGRLMAYECINQPLAKRLILRIYEDYKSKLSIHNEKIEIIGGNKDPRTIIIDLMKLFDELTEDAAKEYIKPLYIFNYSNSGTGTDCRTISIPGDAIKFLHEANCHHFEKTIEDLCNSEKSKKVRPGNTLLECIEEKRFYYAMLPYKKYEGESLKFISFYMNRLMGITKESLISIHNLAKEIINTTTDQKVLNKLLKSDSMNEQKNQKNIKRIMANLAKEGRFSISDYRSIFPLVSEHPIRSDSKAWRIIQIFLVKQGESLSKDLETNEENIMSDSYIKIDNIAKLYFEYYVAERGIKRFEKDILDKFDREEIKTEWLKNVYCKLAKEHEDYTFDDWSNFILDENGKPITYELLFQIRLKLCNLFREYKQGEKNNG